MQSVVDSVVYVIPEANSSLMEFATMASAVAAIASTFAAIAAVMYTHKQIKAHERHNRLMATPHLSGWNHLDSSNDYRFSLENTGLGPAVIKEIILSVRGERIAGWAADLIELGIEKLFGDTPFNCGYEMFIVGDVIPPGKRFDIINLTVEGQSAADTQNFVQEHVDLFIRYESILGDAHTFDSVQLKRQREEAYALLSEPDQQEQKPS